VSNDVFVKFEYDARDIVNAMRLRLASELRGHVVLVLCAIACAAGAVVFCVLGPSWGRYLAAWVLVLVGVQAAFTAVRIVPHSMFRKSAEDQRLTSELRGDFWNRNMSVDASEDGITVTVGRRSATLKWRDCARFESDARSHLIFHGASGFLAVPRRAFRNEKKDATFRELASRLVGASEAAPADSKVRPLPLALPIPMASAGVEASLAPEDELAIPKVGRNDPCPCGSGKKYKKCCLASPVPKTNR
jgi:hypothetical protein